MAKRKEVCIRCGWDAQEIHSMCYNCHEMDMGNMAERVIARVGNDHFTRCDEKDCWVCDSFKWERKYTRPPKYTKKELLNRARGRYGRGNKQAGIDAVERRRIAENQANIREKRDS